MSVGKIKVPPEVVEVGARKAAYLDCGADMWHELPERSKKRYRHNARAVIAAGLAAWEGATSYVNVEGQRVCVLPLPQEVSDDQ